MDIGELRVISAAIVLLLLWAMGFTVIVYAQGQAIRELQRQQGTKKEQPRCNDQHSQSYQAGL